MTLRELQSEICALGFDRCASLNSSLLYSARRALAEISGEARIIHRINLFTSPPKPSSTIKLFHHTGGRTELLPLNGYAFSLSVSGKGRIAVFDGKVKKSIVFDSESKIIKGILFGEGSIEFSGEFSYDVFGITTFSEPYFADCDSIPSYPFESSVDMREMVGDFLEFTGEIADTEGRPIKEARFVGSKIFFPEGFSGEVTVSYYRYLKSPELSSPDTAIDIPREYEPLLPLLCASFLLLDSDREKADYYREIYRKAISDIKIKSVTGRCGAYADVTGWA